MDEDRFRRETAEQIELAVVPPTPSRPGEQYLGTTKEQLPSAGQREFLLNRLAEVLSLNQRLRTELTKELPNRSDSEFADTTTEEAIIATCLNPSHSPLPSPRETPPPPPPAAASMGTASPPPPTDERTDTGCQTSLSYSLSSQKSSTTVHVDHPTTAKGLSLAEQQQLLSHGVKAKLLISNTLDVCGDYSASLKKRIKTGDCEVVECKLKLELSGTKLVLEPSAAATGGAEPMLPTRISHQLGYLLFAHLGQHTQGFSHFVAVLRSTGDRGGSSFTSVEHLQQSFSRSMSLFFISNPSLTLNSNETRQEVLTMLLGLDVEKELSPTEMSAFVARKLGGGKEAVHRLNLVFDDSLGFDLVASAIDDAKRGLLQFPVPVDFSSIAGQLKVLKPNEITFCAKEHISPHVFIAAKKLLFGCGQSAVLGEEFLSSLGDDLDFFRSRRLLQFFVDSGWIKTHTIYRVEDSATTAAMATSY